jgi:glutathione synthase/RimK-type ligase-like ATP-grasp enzyme
VSLRSITGAYLRPMDDQRLPEVAGEPADSPLRARARTFHDLLAQWAEVTEATVVNRYSAMGSNFSKPFQAQLLAAHGFDVPATLVTTVPEEVVAFRDRHGELIYKSISGERSIVRLLTDDDLARLDRIAWCPVQFQEYVPGRDIRVHVVGQRTFATEIVSNGVDYRYDAGDEQDGTRLRETAIPAAIAERCVSLTRGLGLEFTGIDLREAPDGRYVCFEVNPSPAFSYYEAHTGQPIADAVAHHLGGAPSARSAPGPAPARPAATPPRRAAAGRA